jgi:hypothetical protein
MFTHPLRSIDPTQQYVHCSDENDVSFWSSRLHVSPEELRAMLQEVGPKLIDVEECIRQRKRTSSVAPAQFSQSPATHR